MPSESPRSTVAQSQYAPIQDDAAALAEDWGPLDAWCIRLIRFKASQLVGKAGLTKSDREDLEHELAADVLARKPHDEVEKLFEGRRPEDAIELTERISGDTSAGHALAHSLAVEGRQGPRQSQAHGAGVDVRLLPERPFAAAEKLGLGHRSDLFNVVIQAGAILAVTIIYWMRLVSLITGFSKKENRDYALKLLAAFFITGVLGLIATKLGFKLPEKIEPVAWALLIGGIVMWIVDVWSDRYDAGTNHVEEMTLPQAIWIGLCQTLSAIFPGTSRSMSTIAAGQIAGMDRPTALEFSFLLSIPTMIAATLWDLKKEVFPSHGVAAHVVMNGENWIVLIIGFVVSFIVALGVVEWFLFWVRKHGFVMFAIYRILLGVALLVWGAKFLGS